MTFTLWFLIAGALLILMALAGTVLKRLPLSAALLYLAAGAALGPGGVGLIDLDPIEDSALIERITEIAVIISLFTAGLTLRTPFAHGLWQLPVRLATISMVLTVGMIALAGMVGLGLSLGAAVLLGAILAPTDPVLASDVTVENPRDQDDVRFSLTGEAGLNDGSAFPFVMLGLGLLQLHGLGPGGVRWLGIDLLWAVGGGLLVGGVFGTLVGRLVLYLRRTHKEAVGLDNFLSLGLIALAYGAALLLQAYGFLAVFAAGLALRRVERQASGKDADLDVSVETITMDQQEELATHPEQAPAYMAQAVLSFNAQLERIGEVAVVLLAGGMLLVYGFPREIFWFAPLLFLGIRPLAVSIGLLGVRSTALQRSLIAWFGIRGIGSVYYLMYAIEHGLPQPQARELTALTLSVVAISVVLHGVSVTPLMNWYTARQDRS